MNPEDENAVIGACFILDHRVSEKDSPIWCLEFQTGTYGGYACPKKVMRMYAYLSLIYRSQTVLAWTWRSMLGGEEQDLFGLLDHDGVPGRKYYEFKQIAEEFKKIGQCGLPRVTRPEIGIAYSFESLKVSMYGKSYYKTDYYTQMMNTYKALFHSNMDCNIIDLRNVKKDYKLILIPGHCLMDERSAETIGRYVENGGTVVMTAYSAKVNQYNQVFDTPMPGLLHDVFGIRANAFERTCSHVGDVNEVALDKTDPGIRRESPGICFNGFDYQVNIDYYEILELNTAMCLAEFAGVAETCPAISVNKYGNGTAIYVAIPADEVIMPALLMFLCDKLGIERGMVTPKGVVARTLDKGTVIYINTLNQVCTLNLAGTARSLLTGMIYGNCITLDPYEVDIVETV